jgi:predicted ArsR family transcriptional regulator
VASASWDTIAVLADPVRRALYQYVRRQNRPVTREKAADAISISRNLTAFHLDKLVDAGLLRARYESPPDQPRGRGRTPKVYEAIGDGLTLTEPPRRYELLGEILTDTIAANPIDPTASAHWHAAALGRRIGAARSDERLETVLVDLGYEPRAEGAGPAGASDVLLGNCPFHALANRQRELVCGINHAFLTGLLDGLGASDRHAELRPVPGCCCVRLAAVGHGHTDDEK